MTSTTEVASEIRRPWLAFASGGVIGILGGLIGLGGAEFRLPVLLVFFALVTHQTVRINLLVSLATRATAAVARFGFADFPELGAHAPEIVAVAIGAITAAWFGAGILSRLSPARLTLIISLLLLAIAILLAVEGVFHGQLTVGLQPGPSSLVVGLIVGLVIGTVSSLLGVAGGELIIPTMIFIFGADVRTAGTASLIISIPSVLVGVIRHWRAGAYDSSGLLGRLVVPMALGSAAGTIVGGALLPFVSADTLKLILAAILAASAIKVLRHRSGKGGDGRQDRYRAVLGSAQEPPDSVTQNAGNSGDRSNALPEDSLNHPATPDPAFIPEGLHRLRDRREPDQGLQNRLQHRRCPR